MYKLKTMIKESFKKHWKMGLIILVIVLGFIFYYEYLPRYNQATMQIGYNQCVNDYASDVAVPLRFSQGNETQIMAVGVCSDVFQQQYQNICGVSG